MFSVLLMLVSTSHTVLAKSEVISRVDFRADNYAVRAELLYDGDKKKPDLWLEYTEGKKPGETKIFRAASLVERLKDVEWQLKASPMARYGNATLLIYYGFSTKTGLYDGAKSFAIIFHLPVSELHSSVLEMLVRSFPASVVKDATGYPKYLKAVLCRITESQVYPIAAFDAEPSLPRLN